MNVANKLKNSISCDEGEGGGLPGKGKTEKKDIVVTFMSTYM